MATKLKDLPGYKDTPQLGELRVVRYFVQNAAGFSLLMHSPKGMESPLSPEPGPRQIPTPEIEAEQGAYRLPNGKLYLPADSFREAILFAAKGQKQGTKALSTLLRAGLFTVSKYSFCPLVHPETGEELDSYEIDIRRAVVNRGMGVRRARPRLDAWACELVLQYDPVLTGPEVVERQLQLAGIIAGVGDYRIERGGPFGRFRANLIPDEG